MASYIGVNPPQQTGIVNRFQFTATAAQTVFSGADNNGSTLFYISSNPTLVFLNGVQLVVNTDYTQTDNDTITLATGATANDEVEIMGFGSFDLNNAATTRSQLGLGTAATKDVGTSANNVVQLNGSAALPAVDGSNLTGINTDVVDDTTPQLGGNLDVNNKDIVSTLNADIDIIPNGTGKTNFGGTNGIVLPSGTTAQRVNTTGVLRFNTTIGLAEYFNGSEYKSLDAPPTITSVSPTEVDSNAGGNQTIVITGSGFASGAIVTFVGNAGTNFNATSLTVDSSTQISAVSPKSSFLNAQEPYGVKVENTSGLAVTLAGQISIDTDVTWTTSAGSLGSIQDNATGTHFTVVATDPDGDTITYSVTTGSLPAGLSLNSATGAISGDPDDVVSDTTTTFSITATTTNATAVREFSITVTLSPYSADFLVIAGGGGGGTGQFGDQGGGGGAGGYRNSFNSESSGGNSSSESAFTLSQGTVYTVTVGSGGGTSSQGNSSSISGSDISTITSVGGGIGATSNGSQQGSNGGNGGSGGGAAAADLTVSGGSATSGQGSNGGGRSGFGSHSSAGGGGAGQTGGSASGSSGGNGGNGLSSSISGSSVTRGGGGGGANIGSGRAGGSGGGGTGRGGSNGTANTGGGGGGARSGGSGVVILRVPTANYSSTTTGSPTVSTSGSDTIMVFNSSGSYTG